MLKLINGQDNPVIDVDDFYIDEIWNGLDELVFSVSVDDPVYKAIAEETLIEHDQPYLVKAIDGGTNTAKIKAQINLDELKAEMILEYSNESNTVAETIQKVLPSGWLVVDHAFFTFRRTVTLEAATPLEVIQACLDTYGVVVRYDVKHKSVHIWDPDSFEPVGAFATRELNLKAINYKGKSSGFATRLYGYGKDNLSVTDINGGKPYVDDHTYSDKIICAYWKDERYTVRENLLEDMKKRLKQMAVPEASYSCEVVDLAKTDPERYAHQDFGLLQVVKLIDDIKGLAINHQVVQYRRYPNYPERNVITLSTVAPTYSSAVKILQDQIEKPESSFRASMQNAIDRMASAIAGYDGGNLVVTKNSEGKPNGIMIMDTDDQETATKVMWLNLMGITYSSHGVDGPFDTVWSFEEDGFVANYIVAGILKGIEIFCESGTIGGWSIGAKELSANFEYTYPTYTQNDTAKLQAYLLGEGTLTEEEKELYDVNMDGCLNSLDLLAMQRMILGLNETFFKGRVVLDTSNPRACIRVEITEGYQEGRISRIGMGGAYIKSITGDEFFAGESRGVTRDYVIDGKTLSIVNGLVISYQ